MRPDTSPSGLKFKSNNIENLLSVESRWQSWLDVEASMARSQSELKMIPRKAGNKIAKNCNLKKLNLKNIYRDLKITGHKLVPLIWELSRVCDKDSKKYVHWGGTTQNIVSNGDILILRKIHKIFLNDLSDLLKILSKLSLKTKNDLMAGRTHGQHALPITFGYKVACWIDEISRHIERIKESEPRVFKCIFGGAVGTSASFGKYGNKLQKKISIKLGLNSSRIPTRSHLDHFAEYNLNIIMLATTFGKIAQEIYNLMKNEISELEEPITSEDIGSSTMPQKRNPHICQDIISLSAECRSLAPITFDSMVNEHEGSRQNHLMSSYALNQLCIKFGHLLSSIKFVLRGLKINKKNMLKNLEISKGSIVSESVMLKLGTHIGRQQAHKIIHQMLNLSLKKNVSFIGLLKKNPKIQKFLTEKDVTNLINPEKYTGLSTLFSEQMSTVALNLSKKLKKTEF